MIKKKNQNTQKLKMFQLNHKILSVAVLIDVVTRKAREGTGGKKSSADY